MVQNQIIVNHSYIIHNHPGIARQIQFGSCWVQHRQILQTSNPNEALEFRVAPKRPTCAVQPNTITSQQTSACIDTFNMFKEETCRPKHRRCSTKLTRTVSVQHRASIVRKDDACWHWQQQDLFHVGSRCFTLFHQISVVFVYFLLVYLVGGFKDLLFSITKRGCHPSQWLSGWMSF